MLQTPKSLVQDAPTSWQATIEGHGCFFIYWWLLQSVLSLSSDLGRDANYKEFLKTIEAEEKVFLPADKQMDVRLTTFELVHEVADLIFIISCAKKKKKKTLKRGLRRKWKKFQFWSS